MVNIEVKMQVEMATKKRKMVDDIIMGMNVKDEKIVKLEKENQALKEKMTKMKAFYMKELKALYRRGLPIELLNELFGSLPLENAFVILVKMPNGLLARNILKMINDREMAMKNNEWNFSDCSPNMTISEDGLTVSVIGSNRQYGWKTVRAALPIPTIFYLGCNKSKIFYFEMQILKKHAEEGGNKIGFCDPEFLQGNWLGNVNSIGIWYKRAMWIDGRYTELENAGGYFVEGDTIGIGIIRSRKNSSMKCFATCNGEFLGIIELPAKFATLQLYPATAMYFYGDSIRANFEKREWRFKQFDQLLK